VIGGLVLTALLLGGAQDSTEQPWKVTGRLEPIVVDGDTLIQLVESPVFTSGNRELRATWLVLWLNRKSGDTAFSWESDEGEEERLQRELDSLDVEDMNTAPSLFARFKTNTLTRSAREIYLEGPIEYLENGRHVGQAGAIYLDMVEGHGWIADAAISIERSIRGRVTHLRVLADWLRHSADGSLRAEDAIVTSCDFDDPHFHIRTRDLRITPSKDKGAGQFDVTLRHNEIQLSDSISIPLPKLSYPAGSDFTPKYEGIRLGNSSRFGTFAEAEVNGEFGNFGERVTHMLGDAPVWPKGKTKVRLRWLGSRGVLIDTAVKFKEKDKYNWEVEVGGLPDHGRDRGVIRVDKDERDTLRLWYRSRGRFLQGPQEWYDVSFTSQSDPGVQSEFWEKDFLKYEHRDNYVHWRKASGQYYFNASVLGRVDSFRTEVNEYPSLGFSRFSSELFRVGSQPVLYGTHTSAAYLERVQGRETLAPSTIEDGYEPAFLDGLGQRRVKRIHSVHRVEAPFSLPFLGLRATPFAEAQATLWDHGVDKDNSPTRVGAFAGLRLATTFWKRRSGGGLHEISPSLEARKEIGVRETDGTPVRFDSVEDPIEGNAYEVGLRTRWLEPDGIDEVDVELKSTYQSGVPGLRDRWLPVEMYGSIFSEVGDVPFGIRHDARYDFDLDQTVYSSTAMGLDLSRNFGMELGHQRGRDSTGTAVFESASIGARFHWSPKWEFESTVAFSILADGEDRTGFVIRRLGHDFVFEIEFEDRTGEGGSSIGFGFRPLFSWSPSHLGLLRR
jgi:hypothetical protein